MPVLISSNGASHGTGLRGVKPSSSGSVLRGRWAARSPAGAPSGRLAGGGIVAFVAHPPQRSPRPIIRCPVNVQMAADVRLVLAGAAGVSRSVGAGGVPYTC